MDTRARKEFLNLKTAQLALHFLLFRATFVYKLIPSFRFFYGWSKTHTWPPSFGKSAANHVIFESREREPAATRPLAQEPGKTLATRSTRNRAKTPTKESWVRFQFCRSPRVLFLFYACTQVNFHWIFLMGVSIIYIIPQPPQLISIFCQYSVAFVHSALLHFEVVLLKWWERFPQVEVNYELLRGHPLINNIILFAIYIVLQISNTSKPAVYRINFVTAAV